MRSALRSRGSNAPASARRAQTHTIGGGTRPGQRLRANCAQSSSRACSKENARISGLYATVRNAELAPRWLHRVASNASIRPWTIDRSRASIRPKKSGPHARPSIASPFARASHSSGRPSAKQYAASRSARYSVGSRVLSVSGLNVDEADVAAAPPRCPRTRRERRVETEPPGRSRCQSNRTDSDRVCAPPSIRSCRGSLLQRADAKCGIACSMKILMLNANRVGIGTYHRARYFGRELLRAKATPSR